VSKWVVNFLAIIGLLVAVVVPPSLLYRSYQSEGKPPGAYLYVVVQKIGRRWGEIGPLIHDVAMATGLLDGQALYFVRDLSERLPPWRGKGASQFRMAWQHVYNVQGVPIKTADIMATGGISDIEDTESPNTEHITITHVNSLAGLVDALHSANPGAEFVLAPGRYVLSDPINLESIRKGTADRPIRIRASKEGSVVVELMDNSNFVVNSPYLIIEGLILRGFCGQNFAGLCDAAFYLDKGAEGFVLHNAFVSGFTKVIGMSAFGLPKKVGMLRGVTIIGGKLGLEGSSWISSDNKIVDIAGTELRRVCPKGKMSAGCDYPGLGIAFKNAPNDAVFLLYSDVYHEATVIKASRIRIFAEPGAHVKGVSVNGKGALVVEGADTLIDGLECSGIKVRDGNGSCVRLSGQNLRLVGVNFHDSQEGILTGSNTGAIVITDSKFKNNGENPRRGRSHNIYIGRADEFRFIRSWSLTARGEGHELKSRARRNIVRDSVIASFNATDSYLIDFPNGGENLVEGSILEEGPRSRNTTAIAVGLEMKKNKLTWKRNNTIFRSNLIILENWKRNGGVLFQTKNVPNPVFENNVIVGSGGHEAGVNNRLFASRQELGIPAYPSIGF